MKAPAQKEVANTFADSITLKLKKALKAEEYKLEGRENDKKSEDKKSVQQAKKPVFTT